MQIFLIRKSSSGQSPAEVYRVFTTLQEAQKYADTTDEKTFIEVWDANGPADGEYRYVEPIMAWVYYPYTTKALL